MSDFITLTCPNCSGSLQITNDINRFACMYCGVEHVVRRGGGIITLQPVVDELKKVNTGISGVKVGVDKTASELAIQRLQGEISELTRKRQPLEEKLRAVRAEQPSEIIWLLAQGAIVWFVVLVPITIAAASVIDDPLLGLTVVVGVPTAATILYYRWRGGVKAASRRPSEYYAHRLQAEIDALDDEIASVKRELDRHKQLVRQIDN